ncbi:MAG: hypothetical protein PHO66_05430 [Eubacteriales bacterium]|nr:hypothetical protein [Eubacteriales bacterium]
MSVLIKEVQYGDYGTCVSLSNGAIELLVTVDAGPRIIRLATPGGENMFGELPFDRNSAEYQLMGGHRLWHSPEAQPRSYEKDNAPVFWEKIENGIRTVQKPESWAMTEKEMEIVLEDDVPGVSVLHRIRNCGAWPVKLAAWGITILSPGGLEVVPMPRRDTGLLSNRVLGLWPYSNMMDERVTWGQRYITLRQNPQAKVAFKVGLNNEQGWAAYFNHGQVFIKQHYHEMGEKYPDGGMSYETYTDGNVMEMESLSPLTLLDPDKVVEHAEYWALLDDFAEPRNEEEALDEAMGQLISDGDGCGCGGCGEDGCGGCGDDGCGEDGCEGCGDDGCGHHHHHHH